MSLAPPTYDLSRLAVLPGPIDSHVHRSRYIPGDVGSRGKLQMQRGGVCRNVAAAAPSR